MTVPRLRPPALVVLILIIAATLAGFVGAAIANHDRRGDAAAVPVGASGLPAPTIVRDALRDLAARLHRIPDLALIRLEPGVITFQYYTEDRADRGSFIDWRHGRFDAPQPFRFPNNAFAPQLRFDPAELRLNGVVTVDRLRASIGMGNWRIVRAEGFRRGSPISDGAGIVWRVTVAKGATQMYLFTNQAGRFLRIAAIPPPPPPQ